MRLVIFVVGMLIPVWVFACSCHLGSPEEKLHRYPQVFVGVISELTPLARPQPKKPPSEWDFPTDPPIRVKFKIEESIKGSSGEIILDTVYNQQSCNGYFFRKPGERYLIYAFAKGENFDVMWCGGAIPAESSEDFNAELKIVRREKRRLERIERRCAKSPELNECGSVKQDQPK